MIHWRGPLAKEDVPVTEADDVNEDDDDEADVNDLE